MSVAGTDGAGGPASGGVDGREAGETYGIEWSRYATVAATPPARAWLRLHLQLGLAPSTVTAYGRALEDFLGFCRASDAPPEEVSRGDIAAYVRELATRPNARAGRGRSGARLSNATLQQRLTAVRLFYDYLVEEGARSDNPVGRGHHTPGRGFDGGRGEHAARGLVPRYQTLPWLPSEDEWRAVLEAARAEPLRNRLMLALAYDAGLRREELCRLETGDVDPSARLLRIRAETTKGHRERVVPYSAATGELYSAYLAERRALSEPGRARNPRGPLFLSASRRNRGRPITRWTWSKVVAAIARRAGVPRFSTHTPRHLCLTDLARAGWELHEIAQFAGHRDEQSTLRYIHLSGRDLAAKLERGMAALHAWRVQMTAQVLA